MSTRKSNKSASNKSKQNRNQHRPAPIVVVDEFSSQMAKLSKLLRMQEEAGDAAPVAAAVATSPVSQTAPLSTPATTLVRPRQEPKLWEAIDAIRASLSNKDDKYIDLCTAFVTLSSGTVNGLPAIAQGIAFNQRTGDYIRVRRWVLKYELQYNVAAGAPIGCLVMVGRARDGTPLPAAVFSQVGGVNANSLSFPVRPSEFDVQWLKHNHHCLSSNDAPTVKGEFSISPNWITQFSAGATTIIDGEIFLGVIVDNVGGTNPTFRYNLRVEFTDSDD